MSTNMETFFRDFEVRWSDLDVNRHLLNAAYINFMSHVRMAFLDTHNFGVKAMNSYGIGPVALHEHMYYFKEVHPHETIRVTIELSGLSANGQFFSFDHRFYKTDKSNCALGTVLGAWISLTNRKLIAPPKTLYNAISSLKKSSDFKILTKSDTRIVGINPI